MSENFVTRETRRWNGFGVASHIEVRAPPESVWNALIDIDNKALFLSCLESTRRIGSKIGDPVRAGTRWKQTRKQLVFGRLARTRSVSVTCTAIDDQPPDVFPKSMSVISHAEGSAATGTLSVELIDDAEDEVKSADISDINNENIIENGCKKIVVIGTCFEYGMQSGSLKEEIKT